MLISSTRRRVAVIIALIVLSYFWSIPDLSRVFGAPLGDYGFSSVDSRITRIQQGGVADRAGLRVGDRVHLGGGPASALQGYSLLRGASAHPGDRIILLVTSRGATRQITLVGQAEPRTQRVLVALRFVLAFLTVVVSTALVLTRPDAANWGFFLYCLAVITLPGAVLSFYAFGARDLFIAINGLVQNLSFAGGVLFAWMFAAQKWTRLRAAAVAASAGAAILVSALDNYDTFVHAIPKITGIADDAFPVIVLAMMLWGLVDSYQYDSGSARQRLKWMIAALIVSIPARYVAGHFFPGYLTYTQYVALISVQIILPLTAAYALFRKRVVDLNFIISRTLAYTTITAMLVAIFSLMDAVLSHAFAQTRVSFSIDVAVALLLGFALNAAHRRIDSIIDSVLFRERYHAEQTLRRAAAAITHATQEQAITLTLVHLPFEVLKLTGAAFYEHSDGAFVKKTAAGDFSTLTDRVEFNDALPLLLRSELRPVRIDDAPLSALSRTRAVLALPIAMRNDVSGFVVYGPHRNGADIDYDEGHALEPLAVNAAVTLDHLVAESLRSRVARLESILNRQLAQPS